MWTCALNTCTPVQLYNPVHPYTCSCTPIHWYTYTRVHPYICTPIHPYMYTPTHLYTHTLVHLYKTSSGIDNISNKLLKQIKHIIVQPLTLIINQSLTSGIYPDKFKISKITPLHKKDDRTVISNYRPISLLPTMSKIIERIMHSQLYAYFKGECSVFLKKNLLWMKTMHYPNTIRSHLVIIVPVAPFTPKSTSKLRSALHIRYSKVIPRFISRANTAQT